MAVDSEASGWVVYTVTAYAISGQHPICVDFDPDMEFAGNIVKPLQLPNH